jgi:hypothetical protein
LARNGSLADSSEIVTKLKLRVIAEELDIHQKVKIGFPVSLKKFIPENYTPSDEVKSIFTFLEDGITDIPDDIFQGIYMLDLLLKTTK